VTSERALAWHRTMAEQLTRLMQAFAPLRHVDYLLGPTGADPELLSLKAAALLRLSRAPEGLALDPAVLAPQPKDLPAGCLDLTSVFNSRIDGLGSPVGTAPWPFNLGFMNLGGRYSRSGAGLN
jgi:hypothetical protein